ERRALLYERGCAPVRAEKTVRISFTVISKSLAASLITLRRVHGSSPLRPARAVALSILLAAAARVPIVVADAQRGTDCSGAGVVASGRNALSGVVVSISSGGATVDVAATGVDGTYALKIPAAGQYTLRAEFSAFAPVARELTLDSADCRARVDIAMTLASR